MIDIFKDLGKGLIGILIAVFLPKQIFISVREFIIFGFKSIIKHWKFNSVLVLISILINFKTIIFDKFEKLLIIVFVFIFIYIFSIIINLISFYLKLTTNNSLIVYGCYSSKDKEYLFLDLDAELINDRIIKECEILKKKIFILNTKFINLAFIEFPKFIPILFGYRGTTKIFDRFILNKKHISSLYYIRDISDQKIITKLNYSESNFFNGELNSILDSLQNRISNENIDIKEISIINLKLYVLVFGQSFLDIFLNAKNYQGANKILEDSEKILLEINEQINKNVVVEIKEFKDFFNYWSSYIDRYKAIILIEQDELKGAITYILNSIKLNPYYPYNNYETFKINFSKRYGLELSYSIEEVSNDMEIENINDFEKIREQISNSIVAKYAEFNSKILLEIIKRDDKQNSLEYLEKELKKLDDNNSAILLLKSDILKYLPDDTKKINKIYYGRIDESILNLNKILALDNNFPIIKAKIGSLMMIKSFCNGNEEDIENGIKILTEGMHFLTELGFKTK